MHTFKDTKGREWSLEATYGSYGRVHAATGVKLFDIVTDERKSLVQLGDAFTLGAVLWSMIEPQAQARGVTPEEFGDAVNGTVLAEAHAALVEEMIFFCHPRQRKILEVAYQKVLEAEGKADKMVDEMMPEFKAEIDKAIDRWTRGDLDSSLLGSSASTHESGRFGSSSKPQTAAGASSGTIRAPSSPS